MLAALREQARVQQGRNPQPSAGIIDSHKHALRGTPSLARRPIDKKIILRKD